MPLTSSQSKAPPPGMVALPGGEAMLGSEGFYPEERPVRSVRIAPFWIDRTPVTNAQFAAFVLATGYRTLAERPLDSDLYPGLEPEDLAAGSLVFQMTSGPTHDHRDWWSFRPGAFWRAPLGPGSDLNGLEEHPVVHVAHEDALAYARWRGKRLPSEAEWEYAARGGLAEQDYAWGEDLAPGGQILANYWQGDFPYRTSKPDGYRTTPVGAFAANGFGLLDMIGNVWEWTDQGLEADKPVASGCCGTGGVATAGPIARFIVKGGSHLCAQTHCRRYRPAARQAQAADSAASHIGFRCAWSPSSP